MARDNRALELQNTELRTQLQEVKTENLEVWESVVSSTCRRLAMRSRGSPAPRERSHRRRPSLQVSEKIVLLDEEVRKLRLRNSEAEARADQLLADKESMMGIADDLRGEVQEKINLMDEFEAKFARQFRWRLVRGVCPQRETAEAY